MTRSSPAKPGALFDPGRQRRFEAMGRRIGYAFALGSGVLFAVVIWFVAGLWWLSLALLVGVFLLGAGTTWLVTRNPTPTVTCLGCGGRGWIDDLEKPDGACPACGAARFAYYRFRGQHAALTEAEISGADLVKRRATVGLPWI